MGPWTIALIVVGILGVVGVAVIFIFRKGKGELEIRTQFGSLKVKGENTPPPGAVAAGVKIGDAQAGGNIDAHSASNGGVEIQGEAGGNITATHMPGDPPPKA